MPKQTRPTPPPTDGGIDAEMRTLRARAITELRDFFDHRERRTPVDIAAARVASSVISTAAREQQARGAADALQFMIARELSGDREQLERFLTAAMPHAAIVRALPPS